MTTVTADIPAALRYEELDGKFLYRKGYHDVLTGAKTIKEIIGSSSLQALLVSMIYGELSKLLQEKYITFISEPGLHLAHNSNVANDIAIFQLSQIERFTKKYFSTPPEYVVEVDVKIDIDLTDYSNPEDYIFHKTQTMLDFGVGTVIWVTTEGPRKILIAKAGQDWRVTTWESVVEFAPDCHFSLQELLQRRGVIDLL
ncbi:hypothetical protein [Spirosoma fluviale]|uniref:Endonuclease, Uma2 family (Restriction endonuclease fold) n=1 Tax=Spirosoma fluviale TaxID=1597977 RepID=A0A286G037_9BACT|nr:hypothetical protein [Spirosoma fluviale]SOD88828.1 hypothetical protein SAMN06269250_2857 [Spirosoma fluviale]